MIPKIKKTIYLLYQVLYNIVMEGGVNMKFIVMDLDDFIFGNEEWHESER